MKKFLVLAVLIIVAACAGLFFYVRWATTPVAMENVVPAGALVYVDADHTAANFEAFKNSQFWRKLTAIDYLGAMNKLGVSPARIALIKQVREQLHYLFGQDFLQRLFGQEFAIAVYPTDVQGFSADQFLEAASHVYFITRLGPGVRAAAVVSDLMGRFEPAARQEGQVEKYKGFEIHLIPVQNGAFHIGYVRIRDLLVIGMEDRAARKCIDAYRSKTGTMAHDPMYIMTKAAFMPQADVTGYFDFQRFASDVHKGMAQMLEPGLKDRDMLSKQLEASFKRMKGFQTVGYSLRWEKGIIKTKMDLHYDRSALDPDLRPFYDCSPKKNRTLAMIPAGVLGYQWNGCYNMKLYWDAAKKEIAGTAAAARRGLTPDQLAGRIQQTLGLNLDKDVFPALGDEIGGYLADVDTSGPFPVPDIVLFVKIADQAKAQAVIDTLVAQQPSLQPETQEYDGTQINFIPIPLVAGLQPGYAFVNGYLLVATNSDSIKAALDVLQGSAPGLLSSPAFAQVNFGLNGANDGMVYVRVNSVMNKIGDLVDWGNQWMTAQTAQRKVLEAGSEKRLKDLNAKMEEQQKSLASLQAELKTVQAKLAAAPKPAVSVASAPTAGQAQAEATPSSPATGQAAGSAVSPALQAQAAETASETQRKDALEQQIGDLQKSLKAGQQTREQLEGLVGQYAQQRFPDADTRRTVTDNLIKPLLGAFGSFKSFAVRMAMKNNLIEVDYYLKME